VIFSLDGFWLHGRKKKNHFKDDGTLLERTATHLHTYIERQIYTQTVEHTTHTSSDGLFSPRQS